MTPYEIGVLLHYYARTDDHPDMHRRGDLWRGTVERFLVEELIEIPPVDTSQFTASYRITDRGIAYVKALLSVPLPMKTWTVAWPVAKEIGVQK